MPDQARSVGPLYDNHLLRPGRSRAVSELGHGTWACSVRLTDLECLVGVANDVSFEVPSPPPPPTPPPHVHKCEVIATTAGVATGGASVAVSIALSIGSSMTPGSRESKGMSAPFPYPNRPQNSLKGAGNCNMHIPHIRSNHIRSKHCADLKRRLEETLAAGSWPCDCRKLFVTTCHGTEWPSLRQTLHTPKLSGKVLRT